MREGFHVGVILERVEEFLQFLLRNDKHTLSCLDSLTFC